MHTNLERRFTELCAAQHMAEVRLHMFSARYHVLFAALAKDMGMTLEQMASRVGFDPVPDGGNAIMRGEAEPSREDCNRLLAVYLDAEPMRRAGRCEKCGWPIKADMSEGCTVDNCCMRGRQL